jgi:uncharacterized protein (TIGR03067 family)
MASPAAWPAGFPERPEHSTPLTFSLDRRRTAGVLCGRRLFDPTFHFANVSRRKSMCRRTGLLWSMTLGCVALCYLPQAWPEGRDRTDKKAPRPLAESLRGKWIQQSRSVNGKRMEDPEGVYLLVSDDGMLRSYSPVGSSEGPGPTLVERVRYRLDATKEPVGIDTAGRTDWSNVLLGICRLEDDSLTLCFAAKNHPRPNRFSTGEAAGMGEVMIVYRRAGSENK